MNIQEQVNDYLDVLRETGVTNMFSAVPYLAEEFGFSRKEAQQYLKN